MKQFSTVKHKQGDSIPGRYRALLRTAALAVIILMCVSVFAGCAKPTGSNSSQAGSSQAGSSEAVSESTGGSSVQESSEAASESGSGAESTADSTASQITSSGGSSSSSSSSSTTSRFKDLNGRVVKLYMWGYSEEYAQTAGFQPFKKRIAEIKEKFNCDFKILSASDMYFDEIWQSTLAGDPSVDIMDTAGPHTLANPIKNGLYMDLNQFGVFDWRKTKWDQQFLKTTNFGGKQYVCGTVLEGPDKGLLNQAMFFNKRLVKDAGYNPDDIYKWQKDGTWTWAKFLEIAEKISKLDPGNVWGTVGNDKLLYADLVLSNGTNYILKTADGIVFNAGDPKALEALEFYKQLYQKHVMPEADAFSDAKLFTSCKVGFLPEYLERLRYPEVYGAMVDDYGVVMIPKGPKASDYVSGIDWFGGDAIPTGTENAKDIALVIDFMTDPTYATKADENKAMIAARETYVRDEQSLLVFDMILSRSVISPTWLSEPVRSDWLSRLTAIKKGEITAADAIAQVKDNYAQTLKDIWDIH